MKPKEDQKLRKITKLTKLDKGLEEIINDFFNKTKTKEKQKKEGKRK